MDALIVAVFIIGYSAIALEHPLRVNKAASALLTGVLCWTIYSLAAPDRDVVSVQLTDHLGQIAGILFFLLGAMTIVELIDAHDGFEVITRRIRTRDKRALLWIVSLLTFFLSAVLDNLTTAIVMTSMIRQLIADKADRMFFIGMVVIAANAGGAWSPIGDVTTTMLWIGGRITTARIIPTLIGPSLVCMLVPLAVVTFSIRGRVEKAPARVSLATTAFERTVVLTSGTLVLILVPVFKMVTHLPPYMGILLGLAVLWIFNGFVHQPKSEEERKRLSVSHALRSIDAPSILFFLGILVSIAALESTHLLERLAAVMDRTIGNQDAIVICIGLLSSIVDNVPLVAAAIGMYDRAAPPGSSLWEFIAYCAGTGGSIIIIGTAAGVAVMGIEKIRFFWYLKRIGWLAALGYFAGAGVYLLQERLLFR